MFSKTKWLLSLISCAATVGSAHAAAVNIKQVVVGQDSRVDLVLDGKLNESQVRTEYLNDIVQLSISDATVYPAKITSVSGQDLTKVFVYQYAPKLVRVRLSVKGKAESYKNRISLKASGKSLVVGLSGRNSKADQVTASAAQVQKKSDPAPALNDADERALLDKILKSEGTPEAAPQAKVAAPTAQAKVTTTRALTGSPKTEDLINPWKALGSFLFVMALLGAAILGLKRVASLKGKNNALGKLLTRTLGKPEKMIEVVATHYLGPKKSIHVVNVAGRTLVLGVSDGAINLITEFGVGEVTKAAPKPVAQASETSDFLSELGEQIAKESGGVAPSQGAGAVLAGPTLNASSRDRTREMIRNRLEGMKQL